MSLKDNGTGLCRPRRKTASWPILLCAVGLLGFTAARCWAWNGKHATTLTVEQAVQAVEAATTDDDRARALGALTVTLQRGVRVLRSYASGDGRAAEHARTYLDRLCEDTKR